MSVLGRAQGGHVRGRAYGTDPAMSAADRIKSVTAVILRRAEARSARQKAVLQGSPCRGVRIGDAHGAKLFPLLLQIELAFAVGGQYKYLFYIFYALFL